MPVIPATDENIKKAADIIRSGGVAAFPTETVYGLGADALNAKACAKIFEIKRRPFFDPLIVHISDLSMIDIVSKGMPPEVRRLTEKFWPGPLTVILEKSENIPEIVTSGLDSVAVRMPSHKTALRLIELSGVPVAAPSANPFGYLSPTEAKHVDEQLGEDVPMILDGGSCGVGIESTIIKIENGKNYLLRSGGIPIEEIKKITGDIDMPESRKAQAPGMLPEHYSPVTRLKLFSEVNEITAAHNPAYLLFRNNDKNFPEDRIEILSEDGNLAEAAARLFSCLHRLDSLGADIIFAERVPETGLGAAIMDRLTRASLK